MQVTAGLRRRAEHAWLALWLILLVPPLLLRGPLPPDELRYLSVAWEMWARGDFIVPFLNGKPYPDKPPLLFWLIHAGWAVLGVNAWWPQMLPALFALAAALLSQRLVRYLWPGEHLPAHIVPWLLLGAAAFAAYTQLLLFDLLLVDCTLLAWLGLLKSASGERRASGIVAAATALGLLTKGPVMLLHLAGPVLLAAWWRPGERLGRWYGRVGLAVLAGISIASLWAAAAAASGGSAYGATLLLDQTAGRVVDSFAHARPVRFYLLWFPLLLLPWIAWPSAATAVARLLARRGAQPACRFLLAASVPAFVALCFVSGKQVHYLLPIVPPSVALLAAALSLDDAARRVTAWLPVAVVAALSAAFASVNLTPAARLLETMPWSPAWALAAALILPLGAPGRALVVAKRVAFAVPIAVAALEAAFFSVNRPTFDTSVPASLVRQLQDAGTPVAFAGDYEGELHFPGRLTQPLRVIADTPAGIEAWLDDNPRGYVVRYSEEEPRDVLYVQRLRGRWLSIGRESEAE